MKKFFVLILAVAAAVSINGCKNKTDNESSVSEIYAAESSAEEEKSEIEEVVSTEESKESSAEQSEEVSIVNSKEVEKGLKIYDTFSKKYHSVDLWDSIKCYGRFTKDTGDGYYKKGDLVRIIGKYGDKSTVIIYTNSGGVNFERSDIIEFLPLSYAVKESDRLIDTPTLPASQVLEDTYVGVYRDNYGLPCFSPKSEYAEDYGNSLDVVYDKNMIVRYGKLLESISVYSDDTEEVKKTVIPAGSYVGIMSYSYGEAFGMFGVYNDGDSYTIPEYVNDDPERKYMEIMDIGFTPENGSKVYGLDKKTKILSCAEIKPSSSDSEEVIKTVTPKNTVYMCFDDSKNIVYNIVKGERLDVVAESGGAYICLYDDRCFKISKTLVKEVTDDKSRVSTAG